MSFEADIYTVLAAVTPRVFPDFAPVSTARPYVTYQQIGGQVVSLLANTAPGIRQSEVQINVWSDTRKEAMEIARAIEAAMTTATAFTARTAVDVIADYDADVPVYGARQDFRCWHTS
jgi:hypothetical protein